MVGLVSSCAGIANHCSHVWLAATARQVSAVHARAERGRRIKAAMRACGRVMAIIIVGALASVLVDRVILRGFALTARPASGATQADGRG
jgi:hypothetical protein